MTYISFFTDPYHFYLPAWMVSLYTNDTSMSAIFLLIGISLLVAIGFLVAFLWAAKSGQYDDDYTPSVRILFDEDQSKKNQSNTK